MKILIIGAAGLLGQALARQAKAAGNEVHSLSSNLPPGSSSPVAQNLQDAASIAHQLDSLKPQAVFYARGYHPVDACEKDEAGALKLHAQDASAIAAWCSKHGAAFVYFSTDYVFDGKKAEPYDENDAPHPQSVYAKTKLEGEESVMAQPGAMAVLRTSVIYGAHPTRQNFVTWLIGELRAKRKVNVVTDQYSTPTYVEDLAAAALALAAQKCRGLYHATGRSCLSRHEFAKQIAEIFELDASLIKPVKTSSLKQAAHRPAYGCLLPDKLEQETGVLFSTTREGLLKLRRQMGI